MKKADDQKDFTVTENYSLNFGNKISWTVQDSSGTFIIGQRAVEIVKEKFGKEFTCNFVAFDKFVVCA